MTTYNYLGASGTIPQGQLLSSTHLSSPSNCFISDIVSLQNPCSSRHTLHQPSRCISAPSLPPLLLRCSILLKAARWPPAPPQSRPPSTIYRRNYGVTVRKTTAEVQREGCGSTVRLHWLCHLLRLLIFIRSIPHRSRPGRCRTRLQQGHRHGGLLQQDRLATVLHIRRQPDWRMAARRPIWLLPMWVTRPRQ